MLKAEKLILSDNKMELLPEEFNLFPYVSIYSEYDDFVNRSVAWHWHNSFELGYVSSGAIRVRSSDCDLVAERGDGIFINSGVMHKFESYQKISGTTNYTQHFSTEFLAGFFGSNVEQKYIQPVKQCQNLQIIVIHPDNHHRIKMIDLLLQMLKLSEDEPWGFEFRIQAYMSEFWLLLMEETEELRSKVNMHSGVEAKRIREMMDFIQQNYPEHISVADIANASSISVRECTRCFKRCIGQSPIEYLNRYRCRTAAQLLRSSEKSILEISEECGFSTGSYFAHVFSEHMGCSPKEYRVNK